MVQSDLGYAVMRKAKKKTHSCRIGQRRKADVSGRKRRTAGIAGKDRKTAGNGTKPKRK